MRLMTFFEFLWYSFISFALWCELIFLVNKYFLGDTLSSIFVLLFGTFIGGVLWIIYYLSLPRIKVSSLRDCIVAKDIDDTCDK